MFRTAATCLVLIACTDAPGTPANPPQDPEIRVEEVARGLQSPVYLTAPAGDARLFVVEQPGRIRIIDNGSLLPTPFLDIASKVKSGGASCVSMMPTPAPGGMPLPSANQVVRSAAVASRGEKSAFCAANE